MRRLRPLGAGALLALTLAAGLAATRPVIGDQKDQPISYTKPSTNISDIYFFPSPTNTSNVVAVMNVSPGLAAGLNPNSTYFNSTLMYQMKFDSKVSGEAVGSTPVENQVIQFLFTQPANGPQQVYVFGPAAPTRTGTNDAPLVGSVGNGYINTTFQTSNGMTVFTGLRADPFFFDYSQFYNIFPNRNQGSTAQGCLSTTCPQGFNTPGTNSQAATNVLSIVVEMPKSLLEPGSTGPKVAYWASTSSPSGN
jgi:hypothetical protein